MKGKPKNDYQKAQYKRRKDQEITKSQRRNKRRAKGK